VYNKQSDDKFAVENHLFYMFVVIKETNLLILKKKKFMGLLAAHDKISETEIDFWPEINFLISISQTSF